MECVFNCFVIHLITLNVPHYLIQCSTWTSPTLWLLCFSCSLIFGVLFKIGPCCLISNPLTSSQTYGLDEKRSCLRCHCYISDPCVCRLAEASARQPSHRLAPPSQRDCSFFFFHSILAWHTGLWGQAEIISFSLSFYTTSETHCTCANSQTHISKETFLLCLSRRFRKMLQKSSEGRLVQSETSKQYHCSSIVRSFTHWLHSLSLHIHNAVAFTPINVA